MDEELTAATPTAELVPSRDEQIDALELALIEHPNVIDLPLVHRFTPGLYSRELRAPAGTLATTYIHRQTHQFVVLEGVVRVLEGLDEVGKLVSAPFVGVTKAGTRRVCFVHEDAVWVTFHPTQATTVEEAEAELFDFRTLPDGTNVRDRFRDALWSKALRDGHQKEISG